MINIIGPTNVQPARRARPPVSIQRTSSPGTGPMPQQPAPPSKTKYAICFLCLFDGLRTPSIRRLIRKPRTVCTKPLLTFDPSFYAPSSESALPELYRSTMNCPCTMAVDPGVPTVLSLLKQNGTSVPPQRLLLHYFGHGCHSPSSDGCLYFFSEDRTRYKPLKILNVMNTCSCPLGFIFDCPSAACLATQLKTRKDIFAFFACAADESLPLSTDAPLDLFSSCLLMPYDTAIWWHMQRHSSVYNEPRMPDSTHRPFLERFLLAVLDAICFETQGPSLYQAFTLDPTMASLFRGFALAQRIMLSFNLHSTTLPEVKPMASHSLWNVWDIAIDISISLEKSVAEKMLYDLCMTTFDAYPTPSIYPIYTHFMLISQFGVETSTRLLRLLDENIEFADIAARSNLRTVLLEMEKPTETHLLILAKMQVSETGVEMDNRMPIAFSMSKHLDVLKSGMLNICIAISKSWVAAFNKLTQVSIDYAAECAPMSGLLLGLLIERGGRMLGLHGFATKFIALCRSPQVDIRVSAVFLLGCSNDPSVIHTLDSMVDDQSPLVREQVMFALFNFARNQIDKRGMGIIDQFANDSSPIVKKSYEVLKQAQMKNVPNPILKKLIKSVKGNGFVKRYATNIFDIDDLQ